MRFNGLQGLLLKSDASIKKNVYVVLMIHSQSAKTEEWLQHSIHMIDQVGTSVL